jgi:hypothetical protein
MLTKYILTKYKGFTALPAHDPTHRGGKFDFGAEAGGQGISRGLHSIKKLLDLLLGLLLIIREDIALTNRRQVDVDVVRAHHG